MVSSSAFSSRGEDRFSTHPVNVSSVERWIVGLGGGTLAAYGLTRRSPGGLLLTALGAAMLHHGVTGHCDLYHVLGYNTAEKKETQEPIARDVHLETSITINKRPEELYQFWRRFENLPRFMKHLESVTQLDENRSHWVAKGPGGETEAWDAEIYNEKENELIAWRSLPGADIVNAGSVRFEPAANGAATEVKITMNYNIPGGRVADAAARLLGQSPEQLIEADLQRLKHLLEGGEFGMEDFARERSEASAIESEQHKGASKAMGGTLMGRAHSNLG